MYFSHDKMVAAAFAHKGGNIQTGKMSVVKITFTLWGSSKYGSCQTWCSEHDSDVMPAKMDS
jgi:hypothetical protein